MKKIYTWADFLGYDIGLTEKTCLANVNPELAKEWHPTKNGTLTPHDVLPNSGKKAWWKCKEGHEWNSVVGSRNIGRGCPYCSGSQVSKENCLTTLNPKLSEEWHPTKNGDLTPHDVTCSSGKKVWWKGKCGHEWEALIFNRTNGSECPYCAGTKKDFISFEEARKFVRTLKLKGQKEWELFCKHGNKPDNIPSNPYRTYKDKGWISWPDFLGTK